MSWRKPVKGLINTINDMLRFVAISLIKIYQLLLSPYIGRSCRFTPTCSHYAIESFKAFPFHKAFFLTLKRLLKCHPLGPFGYDPVPQSKTLKGRS